MASRRLLSPSSSCTMHRPSFLRSHSTKPSNAHQPQPSSAPEEGSDTPTLARPGLSTRATLTSNISKGLAAIAGTAATVGGNVGHYAKGAVKGDATMLGGDEGGWRDSIGGWVGKKKNNSWIGTDKLVIFPGWAVKRPIQLDDGPDNSADPSMAPFEIALHLSLFASSSRPESAASRTQRIFTRMARSFADLPKLDPTSTQGSTTTTRVGSRAASPGIKEEIGESEFFRELRHERERAGDRTLSSSPEPFDLGLDARPTSTTTGGGASGGGKIFVDPPAETASSDAPAPPPRAYAARKKRSTLANHRSPSPSSTLPPQLSSGASVSTASSSSSSSVRAGGSSVTDDLLSLARRADLQAMHTTMRARLQPFFATVIPHRDVRIDIRPRLVDDNGKEVDRDEISDEPLWTRVVPTSVNGTYDERIVIPWEAITSSPACLDLIFPERLPSTKADEGSGRARWTLEVTATLLQPTGEAIADSAQPPVPRSSTPLAMGPSSSSSVTALSLDRSLALGLPPLNPNPVTERVRIPLGGHKGVRVISDLDDTVKRTDLVGGLREVFRNVFCRDVTELEVEGMGALYRSMVPDVQGFHYVSNSPLELFEPIHSFLHANSFPDGFSLKLKFYGGRSLFHGLWEPAGERKARGVLEILEGFPDSQFVMFGDSAEQDLDLYSQIALERPHQVLGIFIRDVSAQAPSRSSTLTSLTGLTTLDESSASSTASSSTTTTSRSRSSTAESLKAFKPSFSRSPTTSSGLGGSTRSGQASPTMRSRAGSLLRGVAGGGGSQPTTATGHPGPDLAAANVLLEKASSSNSPAALTDSPNASSATLPAVQPGETSEDVLDPLYANLPLSPQLTPSIVGAAQDSPNELMDEAISSARAKALRRADEFRGRFDKNCRELAKVGVVVEKFRRVEEVEDVVRAVVRGEKRAPTK